MRHRDSRRGGIISGLFFGLLTGFLCLILVGMVFKKTFRVKEIRGTNGSDVAIETPAGRLNIQTRDRMNPAIVGVPVYPGAYRENGAGGAKFEWSSNDGATDKDLYVVGGEYRTKDSPRKVIEFYRQQLPSLMIVSEKDESTRLEYKEGGLRRIISITEKDGETRIGVASIGGRESN